MIWWIIALKCFVDWTELDGSQHSVMSNKATALIMMVSLIIECNLSLKQPCNFIFVHINSVWKPLFFKLVMLTYITFLTLDFVWGFQDLPQYEATKAYMPKAPDELSLQQAEVVIVLHEVDGKHGGFLCHHFNHTPFQKCIKPHHLTVLSIIPLSRVRRRVWDDNSVSTQSCSHDSKLNWLKCFHSNSHNAVSCVLLWIGVYQMIVCTYRTIKWICDWLCCCRLVSWRADERWREGLVSF